MYNYRMRTLLKRTLILFTVFGLISTPLLITGSNELERATFALESGNFPAAAAHYERVLHLFPWRSDLFEHTANAFYLSSDNIQSILYFEQARKERFLSEQGYDRLGQAYWQTGERSFAERIWLEGVDRYPTSTQNYYNLSFAYYLQSNFVEEKKMLLQWVCLGGDTVKGSEHYRLGILLVLSEPELAEEQFLLASSKDPEYDAVTETMLATIDLASLEGNVSRRLVLIGRGLGLVNEWPLAAEAFRQSVAADGENSEAWAWLGEAEQQLGRDGRAELDMALRFGRTNPFVRSLRGLYWTRQGRGRQALAEYLLAAEYDPVNPVWEIAIGDAYVQSGDLLTALNHYLRATQIAPDDANTWRLLAVFSAQYGVQVETVGLSAAQMAVELTGDDPFALDTLGWVLTLLERYDEAQDVLEHAISLDPAFAQAYLHLGVLFIQLEDWENARENLSQARDLDQESFTGERAQEFLNQYFP